MNDSTSKSLITFNNSAGKFCIRWPRRKWSLVECDDTRISLYNGVWSLRYFASLALSVILSTPSWMPSKAKILETLYRLDSGKDYNISQDLDQNFKIKNTRQLIRYADLLNSYRNDKIKFKSHVKPSCASHQSRRDLIGLFKNKSLNDKLLRIFNFPDLAKHCTWNSLSIFYELFSLVPRELKQKLNHLAMFWEKLSLLTECSENIYCDKDTPSKISDLWSLKCESDMKKLHTLEKSRLFFALITNSDIRRNIVNRIATLDYRVLTFSIIISESSALLQLALLLRKKLNAIDERQNDLGWSTAH